MNHRIFHITVYLPLMFVRSEKAVEEYCVETRFEKTRAHSVFMKNIATNKQGV